MKHGSRTFKTLLRAAPALLFTSLFTGQALAQRAAPTLAIPCTTFNDSFAIKVGTTVSASLNPYIAGSVSAGNIIWTATSGSPACTGGPIVWTCAGMTITLPTAPVAPSVTVPITGGGLSSATSAVLTVQAMGEGAAGSCVSNITFKVTADGGGWGDPHLTTVDGVHYDFQSAGEFTALRDDQLVIQTRQTPVPTATVPITNPYTGITHCVAIYTAVAAKVGSTRVTLQPSPGAEPDPKSMQLRVNGKLVQLGDTPLVLSSPAKVVEGTLTQHADGVIELADARGTQLVVTPSYWSAQKVWYLNVNVYGTTANQGTMGSIAPRSWLPALPDGSSVGPKPESEAARYKALYETFADAWRVTDATSLFDYAPGTNTATFTRDEWPRNHPQSCGIEGQPSVPATTEQVAQEACAGVVDAVRRADCVFDVMITGNTGFAKSYVVTQRFTPRPPGWSSPTAKPPSPAPCPPEKACPPAPPAAQPWWCCWLGIVLGVLQLALLVFLVVRALKKKP